MNLLYITDAFKNLTVFDSQVHSLCEEHGKYINVKLLVPAGIREFFIRSNPSNYVSYKTFRFPKSLFRAVAFLNIFFVNQKKLFQWTDIIQCRGHMGTFYGLLLLKKYHIKKPIIADIRGIITDEIKNSPSILFRNALYKEAEKIENFIMEQDINYFFVSNKMKKYYFNKYRNKNIKEKSWVFPTVVKDDLFFRDKEVREKTRAKFDIENNRIVVAYCGGLDYWQNFKSIAKSFYEAVKINRKLFLFIITKEKEKALNIIKSFKIDDNDFVVLSLSYEKVGIYLQAADYGLLIRENILINKLSFPTKFGEYLNCGLEIIATQIDADYIDIMREKSCGIIIENIGCLKNCLESLRKPVNSNHIRICNLEGIAKKQRTIYQKISQIYFY